MRDVLSITYEITVAGKQGLSDIKRIEIETDDIPAGSYPKSFSGRFVAALEVNPIRFAAKTSVSFRGKPYKLDNFENDGTFHIHRDW